MKQFIRRQLANVIAGIVIILAIWILSLIFKM